MRKFVMARRGLLDHDTLRSPAPALSETTKHEIRHLLGRLARTDPRAAIPAAAHATWPAPATP